MRHICFHPLVCILKYNYLMLLKLIFLFSIYANVLEKSTTIFQRSYRDNKQDSFKETVK